MRTRPPRHWLDLRPFALFCPTVHVPSRGFAAVTVAVAATLRAGAADAERGLPRLRRRRRSHAAAAFRRDIFLRHLDPPPGVSGSTPRPADSSAQIGENNDRAGTAELTGAFAGVGALALPAASSPDADRLVSLPPGLRSVHAGGRATPGGARLAVHTVP